MTEADIDFEGTGTKVEDTTSAQQQQNDNSNNANNQDDSTSLNSNDNNDITSQDGGNNNNNDNQQEHNDNDNNHSSSTGELTEGDTVEVDGVTYVVDSKGNLVDDKGAIFKEAKDVKDWLASVEVDEGTGNEGGLDVASIQEALGITVTDAEGNPVEFTNDAAGVKAYVNSVIDLKSNEIQQGAINKLYADNPMLKQFVDYVQLNGTPRGFGDIPDRSGIQLSRDNVAQQEAIIRMAAQEFGNKSLNDNYIKYLKDGGGLYEEAKEQLKALVEKDVAYRKDLEQRAAAQRQAEAESVANYWKSVNKVIDSRIIAGYKLPESFTKEVDGHKLTITPNDFYNYLSKATETDTDGNKVTGYQRDLNNLTDEEYLNRELLDAWLMFTGGTYKDLIDMAVKEDKVRQLRVKSKEQRANKSVKIVKKSSGKADINDIIL